MEMSHKTLNFTMNRLSISYKRISPSLALDQLTQGPLVSWLQTLVISIWIKTQQRYRHPRKTRYLHKVIACKLSHKGLRYSLWGPIHLWLQLIWCNPRIWLESHSSNLHRSWSVLCRGSKPSTTAEHSWTRLSAAMRAVDKIHRFKISSNFRIIRGQ